MINFHDGAEDDDDDEDKLLRCWGGLFLAQ